MPLSHRLRPPPQHHWFLILPAFLLLGLGGCWKPAPSPHPLPLLESRGGWVPGAPWAQHPHPPLPSPSPHSGRRSPLTWVCRHAGQGQAEQQAPALPRAHGGCAATPPAPPRRPSPLLRRARPGWRRGGSPNHTFWPVAFSPAVGLLLFRFHFECHRGCFCLGVKLLTRRACQRRDHGSLFFPRLPQIVSFCQDLTSTACTLGPPTQESGAEVRERVGGGRDRSQKQDPQEPGNLSSFSVGATPPGGPPSATGAGP